MISSIQLKQITKQRLDSLKNKEKLQSYDQIITQLLNSHKEVPEMFGFNKKKPIKFTRKDEMDFDEL